MHCGYVLMAANPWASGKVIIFVVGTRATGTQAALLALMRGKDDLAMQDIAAEPWRKLSFNNRYNTSIPAKVVRARKAKIVNGDGFLHEYSEITVPDKTRISQRHIVTGAEFLE